VIAWLTARRAVRSGVIFGYVFGVAIASSAIGYTRFYKTAAQRDALAAAYGSDKATSALFGPAPQLQTVAGFTVFKISMTLILLGAVWGLLTSTRLLRGEEEAGRWELLLAGPTTRRAATVQVLGGLGVGVVALWALTGLITALTRLDARVGIAVGPALYFALAMTATAVMFLAVGALTSQLAATRRQAAAYAAWVLGVSYAARLVADAGLGLHGLIWVSPLGWAEELRPLTAPQPLALVPIAALTAVLLAATVYLAGTRDVGAGIVPDRASRRPQLRLLGGPAGLAVRLVRPSVIGWWVAIAVSSVQVLSRLGSPGNGTDAVLGVCFLILAVLVAFTAAGQVTAARSEESAGRLEALLTRPVSRTRWLGGRLLVTIVALLASGVIAGVFAWAGAASQHAGVSFGSLAEAGVNLVPPAITIAGAGVLALGVWPRGTSIVLYALLAWSLLVVVIGGVGGVSRWILDTSVFHQMASAPAVPPHWEADAIMAAIGVAGALIGGIAFRRRDLQGG
jgi:ABC-2 type transport system permease protein